MKIIIIGGGPAGLMAAAQSSKLCSDVTLIEAGEKLGKKLYITGKGRCNVTNDLAPDKFLENIVNNKKFLFSSIYSFTPQDTIKVLESENVKTKIERGGRVFPASDKASDIIKALTNLAIKNNVKIMLKTKVIGVKAKDGYFEVYTASTKLICNKLIIATGGVSYIETGSTGDGFDFAEKLGHNIVPLMPALVGINLFIDESLAGLSLENVNAKVIVNKKIVAEKFGEMLFTHSGVSGPIILSISSLINRLPLNDAKLIIDLKPALDFAKLDKRLIRDFEANKNRDFKNYVPELLPRALIENFLQRLPFNSSKKINEITKQEREFILNTLKNFDFKIKSLDNINRAIVTSGGVDVKEVSSKTMESKLIKGLYFAGEVLDVDAFTGGFNIQTALSTGYIAGINASKEV